MNRLLLISPISLPCLVPYLKGMDPQTLDAKEIHVINGYQAQKYLRVAELTTETSTTLNKLNTLTRNVQKNTRTYAKTSFNVFVIPMKKRFAQLNTKRNVSN